MITMEKIDYVISVTGENYENVRKALLDANGDVDEAIEILRGNRQKVYKEDAYQEGYQEGKKQEDKSAGLGNHLENFVDEIIDAIKEIWNKGNASKLIIEDEGKTVLSLSLTVSAIGIVLSPLVALIGVSAAVISKYDFKVIMDTGEVIDLKEYIKSKKN
ncbi:MAG: DUF4342 domain-containing protein [Tissierellia bacterium]|nr:DUF4342 domain-containing protein [Tissierellia bacterium]